MSELSKVSVVLPSLDPDEKLGCVIDGLLEYGFTDIILVNDGSKPENLHYFEEAARHPEVHLLHHPVNRGKGAALKTAFAWFLANRPEAAGVVTVDGDNQHHPADTKTCTEHMMLTNHLVLGVRDFNQPDVPARSRSGNKITSLVFKLFVGMTISDTQTGLRAIPRKELSILLGVGGDRFEYETNMLLALKKYRIPFEEVKIRTVYIEENKSSHFHAVKDSWRIYKLIFAHFFKYTLTSLLCALVDEGLYVVLTWILHDFLKNFTLTAVCALGARAVSSLLNYFMNRKLVFHSNEGLASSVGKYYALAIPMAGAQVLLTHLVNTLFAIPGSMVFWRSISHLMVMILLYFVSFSIQQRWVFTSKKEK